jgi:hypothetical protein
VSHTYFLKKRLISNTLTITIWIVYIRTKASQGNYFRKSQKSEGVGEQGPGKIKKEEMGARGERCGVWGKRNTKHGEGRVGKQA